MGIKVLFVDIPAIQLNHLQDAIKTGPSPSYPYRFSVRD